MRSKPVGTLTSLNISFVTFVFFQSLKTTRILHISVRFNLKDMNTFIQQRCIQLKVTVKTFLILQKISNKCCSFELSIYQRILKTFQNISQAENQHVGMISEESCNVEDWHFGC